MKAAKDKGNLDYRAVQKILGISEDTPSAIQTSIPNTDVSGGSNSGNQIQAESDNHEGIFLKSFQEYSC